MTAGSYGPSGNGGGFDPQLIPGSNPYQDRMPVQGDAAVNVLTGYAPGKAIDALKPDSELHEKVREFLLKRLNYSEGEMERFYYRWAVNEQKAQAYIYLPDYEQALKNITDAGGLPQPTQIIVPFTWAALSTLVTYMVATFLGRTPHFQLTPNDSTAYENARNMEAAIQYQCDHTRMVRRLHQKFWDMAIYGVGACHVLWKVEKGMRTVRVPITGPNGVTIYNTKREERTTYEGNAVHNIDPYCFFPDPRSAMSEVNQRGEFAFWRFPESRLYMKRGETAGEWKWIDAISKQRPKSKVSLTSRRAVVTDGDAFPGLTDQRTRETSLDADFIQIDQGTCWIIPKEMGLQEFALGNGTDPELWLFALGNKDQIIQAEPFHCDHGSHPLAVSEPFGLGYAFGQPAPADFLNPIQDLVSWLVGSHMDNVRSVLNDCFIFDPSAIESQDMKDMGPGRRYRLKPASYGRDVRTILQQIPITDVTRTHLEDAQLFMNVGMMLLGMNQAQLGQPEPSSRRSASEARITAEASVSRLGLIGRLTSAQGIADMVNMMTLNTQQYITAEFVAKLLGPEGNAESAIIRPENLVGDFNYMIHDGTLPLDRIALSDVWTQLITLVQGDQQLRMNWDLDKMIEHAAEIAGATNIDSFRLLPANAQMKFASPDQIQQGTEDGTLVPAGGGPMGPMGPMTPPAPRNPDRGPRRVGGAGAKGAGAGPNQILTALGGR